MMCGGCGRPGVRDDSIVPTSRRCVASLAHATPRKLSGGRQSMSAAEADASSRRWSGADRSDGAPASNSGPGAGTMLRLIIESTMEDHCPMLVPCVSRAPGGSTEGGYMALARHGRFESGPRGVVTRPASRRCKSFSRACRLPRWFGHGGGAYPVGSQAKRAERGCASPGAFPGGGAASRRAPGIALQGRLIHTR